MATYDQELLATAHRLLRRREGLPGKLPAARVRRSISTSYYALFHFVLDEAGKRLVGSHNDLRGRRRILARMFTHAGVKATLERVRGATIDAAVADFLRPPGGAPGSAPSPAFARNLANVFSDAQAKRHDADYDLNKTMSEADARLLRTRVKRVISGWRQATGAADRDFKHALCILMLLRGQLRRDV